MGGRRGGGPPSQTFTLGGESHEGLRVWDPSLGHDLKHHLVCMSLTLPQLGRQLLRAVEVVDWVC